MKVILTLPIKLFLFEMKALTQYLRQYHLHYGVVQR